MLDSGWQTEKQRRGWEMGLRVCEESLPRGKPDSITRRCQRPHLWDMDNLANVELNCPVPTEMGTQDVWDSSGIFFSGHVWQTLGWSRTHPPDPLLEALLKDSTSPVAHIQQETLLWCVASSVLKPSQKSSLKAQPQARSSCRMSREKSTSTNGVDGVMSESLDPVLPGRISCDTFNMVIQGDQLNVVPITGCPPHPFPYSPLQARCYLGNFQWSTCPKVQVSDSELKVQTKIFRFHFIFQKRTLIYWPENMGEKWQKEELGGNDRMPRKMIESLGKGVKGTFDKTFVITGKLGD